MSLTIYHNPACTKSRATLALLQQKDVALRVIEYLKTPPTVSELKAILAKLGMTAAQLIRKSEHAYREFIGEQSLAADQLLTLMTRHPELIERPIVVSAERAIIGRPPEAVLKLFE